MAAAASQQRRVVITLYKALLRGAGAADAAGKAGSAPVAAMGELARLTGGAHSGVAAVKARFAEGRAAAGARADAAVASALTALPQVRVGDAWVGGGATAILSRLTACHSHPRSHTHTSHPSTPSAGERACGGAQGAAGGRGGGGGGGHGRM
jgi:hypothetical protein